MKLIELVIDEESVLEGVSAMSVVSKAAIMKDFVAFESEGGIVNMKTERVEFAEAIGEEQMLVGAAMIPNLAIYRKSEEEGEYYNYYTAATTKKASQLFMKMNRQNSATLEHAVGVGGMSVVESWLVETLEDKANTVYNLDVPIGTWMIAMKVYNDAVWTDFIKTGKLNGFSVEGYFSSPEQAEHKATIRRFLKGVAKAATLRK